MDTARNVFVGTRLAGRPAGAVYLKCRETVLTAPI
jgi:hypothetical protein